MISSKGKKGIALIIALWIMTILMVVAASFAFMMRTELKMATNFRDEIQAHYLARAGVERAIALLRNDGGTTDHLGEAWFQGWGGTWYDLGEGGYSLTVLDEAGMMNLNAPLLLPDHWDRLGAITPQGAVNIIDYRDSDDIQTLYQTSAKTYSGNETNAKNRDFDTIREMVKVADIGTDIFDAQQKNITVYSYDINSQVDGSARININSADYTTLRKTLGINDTQANNILAYQPNFSQHFWLDDLEEKIEGFGVTTIKKIADKIKVTDDPTLTGAININTASAAVLSAFGFTSGDVTNIINYRTSNVFATRGDILSVSGIKAETDFDEVDEPVCDLLAVRSNCFRIISTSQVLGGSEVVAQRRIEAVVNRDTTPIKILYWSEHMD